MASNKIDLNYRPQTYRFPPNFEALALQAIKGTKRRDLVKKLIKEGNFEMLSSFTQKESLTPKERQVWGRIHPMFMGGEYLPDLGATEYEIARISVKSTTGDVTTFRARYEGNKIYYSVADEYMDEGNGPWYVSPQSSTEPLTLGEMIHLIDTAKSSPSDAQSFLALIWEMNMESVEHMRDLEGFCDFITVSSDFYPNLQSWYAIEIDRWMDLEKEKLSEYSKGDDFNDLQLFQLLDIPNSWLDEALLKKKLWVEKLMEEKGHDYLCKYDEALLFLWNTKPIMKKRMMVEHNLKTQKEYLKWLREEKKQAEEETKRVDDWEAGRENREEEQKTADAKRRDEAAKQSEKDDLFLKNPTPIDPDSISEDRSARDLSRAEKVGLGLWAREAYGIEKVEIHFNYRAPCLDVDWALAGKRYFLRYHKVEHPNVRKLFKEIIPNHMKSNEK